MQGTLAGADSGRGAALSPRAADLLRADSSFTGTTRPRGEAEPQRALAGAAVPVGRPLSLRRRQELGLLERARCRAARAASSRLSLSRAAGLHQRPRTAVSGPFPGAKARRLECHSARYEQSWAALHTGREPCVGAAQLAHTGRSWKQLVEFAQKKVRTVARGRTLLLFAHQAQPSTELGTAGGVLG